MSGKLPAGLFLSGFLVGAICGMYAVWPTHQKIQVKADANFTASQVIAAVNEVRSIPLAENASLDASALSYANRMCAGNIWAHGDWRTAIPTFGYNYDQAGENLAYSDSRDSLQSIISAWVASPGHYENMIRADYVDTGVGVVICPSYQGQTNRVIIAQHFGSPKPAVKPAPTSVLVTGTVKDQCKN